MDNNKVDYISWAGSGSNKRSEGASALLANGKNTAYYYFKGAPTLKTFTLNYDANGGTGAPATQTYTATSQYENSHTFTISSKTPTREGYEFKGWAESLNDTAATRQPGGSIVVTGTTTLYAVWGNHEHKDKNGDGYCDTDHECMHEKDQDGYCTVDGCTHPHEGDGACCPKKSDNKPERPKPENTPAIPGLTDINAAVKVKCETVPASHEEKTFGFNWFSCQVGEVINDNNEYFCTITVLPDEYVTTYNVMHYPGHTHTLDPDGQKDTLRLKWNATAKQWENTESAKLPITFTVKCDTVEPTKPDKPGESVILDLINKINVQCIANTDPKHPEKDYDPIAGSYTVGEVEGNPQSGYTCTVTIVPDKYVEKYNADVTGANHTLAAGEGNKTVKLKYDSANDEWKVDIGMPVVFKVQCDNTQPPLDPITIEVSKVWEDDIPGAQSITVGLYANGIKVKNATIRPDSEGTWFHRFDNMPANDSNGNPINYTVKEENIPDGYTPHYYTSGEHDKRLVFRVKNVPTDKTGAIKVSKELSGEGAEKDKEFAFTVTLLEYLDSNEVLDGGEPGYYPLSGIYTFGGFEFRDGKVTFGLKGGESVTISGIPAEYDYTVTESNNAGYTVTSENDKGTIRAKGTAEVKFTNTKSAAPTVSPTPTPTPGGGNGGGGHWHPTTTPVPVIVIPPKTGDMTIWQSILHFLGIR
ncbi:MAG: Cna B-type domain-containing protein [Christensenellales bacterium]